MIILIHINDKLKINHCISIQACPSSIANKGVAIECLCGFAVSNWNSLVLHLLEMNVDELLIRIRMISYHIKFVRALDLITRVQAVLSDGACQERVMPSTGLSIQPSFGQARR